MKVLRPLFIALTLVVTTPLTPSQQIECDLNNRPLIETCNHDPYPPVCGYYTENCPFSACATPWSSPCYACSDSTILYYETGDCPLSQQVTECDPSVCDPFSNPGAIELEGYYSPVCGIKQECGQQENCNQTFINVCTACNDTNSQTYPFYQDGPCEKDKIYCNSTERPTSCSSNSSSVCALFTGTDNITHFTNVSNGCDACLDPSVEYYTEGDCGRPLSNKTYCLPNQRPTTCDNTSEPVCGFYTNNNNDYDHKIIENACNACADENITYYTPGPCVFYCDRNPFTIYECAGKLNPICGSYQVNGTTKKISLRNSCLGCYGVSFNIESYTEGLCPGDQGILCVNNGGAFLDGMFDPVCGLNETNCTSDSCRTVYSSPQEACSSGIEEYSPGFCPGYIGVPCDNYREGRLSLGASDIGNVCGYSSNNCSDSSCKMDYDTVYRACSNTSILYFTAGSC